MPVKGKKSLAIDDATHHEISIESARTKRLMHDLVADAWKAYKHGKRTKELPDGLTDREAELCAYLVNLLRASGLSELEEGARDLIVHHLEILEKHVKKT